MSEQRTSSQKVAEPAELANTVAMLFLMVLGCWLFLQTCGHGGVGCHMKLGTTWFQLVSVVIGLSEDLPSRFPPLLSVTFSDARCGGLMTPTYTSKPLTKMGMQSHCGEHSYSDFFYKKVLTI